MDAEGSHSGDRNGCGDGKQWRRVKGIVGERKRCRGEGMVGEWKGWQRGKGWRRAEAMPRDGKAARGRDAEGKGCWASGASSASERHDCG